MSNTNKCIIKILDEVNAVIIGLKESEYRELSDHYAMFAKNYRFHPKFKLGRWDGKIRFFSNNGKTYVNLLPEIIELIKTLGYKLELKDCRQPLYIEIPEIDQNYFSNYELKGKKIILAEHQVDGVNAITQNNHIGCIEAGTGAGKSLMNAALCDLYNKHCGFKTLTIVPTSDLVDQTKKVFSMVGLDVGEYSGTIKDLNHDHIICTWQSIIRNLKLLSMFHMVVGDEAHNVTGKSLQMILNEYGSHIAVRIGLTGTIPDNETDAMTLRMTLGDIKFTIRSAKLIELGWLAKLKIKIYQLKESLNDEWIQFQRKNPEDAVKTTFKEFKNQFFPDYPSEKNYLVTKESRNEFISMMVEDKLSADKGNCLIIVRSVDHGKRLQNMIPGSYFVDGTDSKKVRRQIYDLFDTNNDLVLIATAKLVSTGLDIPRIFYLFLIDIGKAYTTVIQSIGRGLRKADDKDSIEVNDITSDLKFSKSHLTDRKRFYKHQSYNYTIKTVDYD